MIYTHAESIYAILSISPSSPGYQDFGGAPEGAGGKFGFLRTPFRPSRRAEPDSLAGAPAESGLGRRLPRTNSCASIRLRKFCLCTAARQARRCAAIAAALTLSAHLDHHLPYFDLGAPAAMPWARMLPMMPDIVPAGNRRRAPRQRKAFGHETPLHGSSYRFGGTQFVVPA